MLRFLESLVKPLIPRSILLFRRRWLKQRRDRRFGHVTEPEVFAEKMHSRLEYEAPPEIHQALADLGRTEDLRFSPSNRRLALASFDKNRILVLDVQIVPAGDTHKVLIEDYLAFSSKSMSSPHGVSFIDENTVIVANRGGSVSIFTLPPTSTGQREFNLAPSRTIRRSLFRRWFSPGAVDLYKSDADTYKVFVCNNYAHVVTSYSLKPDKRFRVGYKGVLLKRGLAKPDGIGISSDRKWIAVSNSWNGTVRIYENIPGLNRKSDATGILRGMVDPHGLRFTADGRHLLVADGAAPYVHVFESDDGDWGINRDPVSSARVLDNEIFQRGSHNPKDGGPKGIDTDGDSRLLATTCEHQVLAFFDLKALLSNGSAISWRGWNSRAEPSGSREGSTPRSFTQPEIGGHGPDLLPE